MYHVIDFLYVCHVLFAVCYVYDNAILHGDVSS